ncbi:MAG: NAD(P)-dependent glycerol-3-phosphate dehydrogenase [Rhodobacteraceae bacterium]|nr:NAD(P)-dependent glycerol-3-phosphate dehydrogenase [Paracoccaceae bacterium]
MIGIAGAGAFGSALAVALGRAGQDVTLWARDPDQVRQMAETQRNLRHLGSVSLPQTVSVTAEIGGLCGAKAVLLAVPMQSLRGFMAGHGRSLDAVPLVTCCKGMDLATLNGPTALIRQSQPQAMIACLTGPSFAVDIAQGLPTALTLACESDAGGEMLQHLLSTPTLRLYRTTDVIGAELGGALKNVIAIAAGIVIGAGLGESARAALVTRGFAEMVRFASRMGARPETMMGLSGLGDLVLTCTSEQSRNFRHGQALGKGIAPDSRQTVEGVATAQAILAQTLRLGMAAQIPVTAMVAQVTSGRIGIAEAIHALMTRPLKEE